MKIVDYFKFLLFSYYYQLLLPAHNDRYDYFILEKQFDQP